MHVVLLLETYPDNAIIYSTWDDFVTTISQMIDIHMIH